MSKKKNKQNEKKEPSNPTIKDYLNKKSLEELKEIYNLYKKEIYPSDNLPKLTSKEEIVEFLSTNLPKYFQEYICIANLSNEEEQTLKEVKTTTSNQAWLSLGFMYKETIDNEDYYIIPEELIKNYKEIQEENSNANITKLDNIFRLYCFINGIISYTFLKEIIKHHNIKVNEEGLKQFLKDQNLTINNDYILPSENDFKDLIEKKKELSFPLLELNQLYEHFNIMLMFIEEIASILKISNDEASNLIIPLCFSEPNQPELIIEEIKNAYKTANGKNKKLLNVINKYEEQFRYWVFNGRTYEEYINKSIMNDFLLPNKPKNTSLKNCIAILPDKAKDVLKDCYNATAEEEIIDSILDSFNEFVYFFDRDFAESILNNQDIDFAEHIEIEDIVHGYFFIYKENEQVQHIVPEEIKKVFERIDLNDLEHDCECADCTTDVIIANYLRMNGIIENKKLQELLKENHDIDLTVKELDEKVKEDYYIILDKYYTSIIDLEEPEAKNLIETKKEYDKYKVYDTKVEETDELFDSEINDLLDYEINIDDNIKDELYSGITFLAKMAIYNEDNLNTIINEIHANLNNKDKKKIDKVVKKYKDKISIWPLNGFSINEYQKVIK